MAGDWTIIEHATPRKPELMRIAACTGLSRHHVLGMLVEFWIWAESMTVDGTIDLSLQSLPPVVGGDLEFWRAVRDAGWLDTPNGESSTPVVVPRADHWLTWGAKARLANTRRKQLSRSNNPSGDPPVGTQVGARTRPPPGATKARQKRDKSATTGQNRKKPSRAFSPESGESFGLGGQDSRPGTSVFDGLREDDLGDVSRLAAWLRHQALSNSPVLPDPDRDTLRDIVAAAQNALARGRNRVGYFVTLVSKGRFSNIPKRHRDAANVLVAEYLKRIGK